MFTITSKTDETFKKELKSQKELKKFVAQNVKLIKEFRFKEGDKELSHQDITKLLFGF